MKEKIFFVVNPVAGKGYCRKIWPKMVKILKSKGVEFSWEYTSGYRAGLELTEKAINSGYRTVVAVGGDGTLWEVVNKIAEHKDENFRVGVIPAGTGNDFSRSLGISSEPFKALEVICQGKTRTIDLGKINGKYFINALGVGFDSLVAQKANEYKGVLKGKLVYLWSVLKVLKTFNSPLIKLEIDGKEVTDRFVLVAAGNACYYGGGLKIAPGGVIDDGYFDLVLVRDLSKREILFTLPRLYNGSHINHRRVEVVRCKQVRIVCDPPFHLQADGEILGKTPQTISIEPSCLNFICP